MGSGAGCFHYCALGVTGTGGLSQTWGQAGMHGPFRKACGQHYPISEDVRRSGQRGCELSWVEKFKEAEVVSRS